MRAFLCASVLMLGVANSAFALLPPLFQTASEIEGLLKSPKLGTTLNDAEVIMSITKTDDGYRITTNKHHVDVQVKTLKQDRPGPARFEYIFGDPQD